MNNHLYIENNDINESSYRIEIFTENTKIRNLIIKEFMQYLFIELLHEIIHIRKYYINEKIHNMIKNIEIDDTYIKKKNVIIKPFYNKLSIFYQHDTRIFNFKLKYSYRLPSLPKLNYCDNIIQHKINVKITAENTACTKKNFLQISYSLIEYKCTLLCTTDLYFEQSLLIKFLCMLFTDINPDDITVINAKLIITFFCSFSLNDIKKKLQIFKKLSSHPEIFIFNAIKDDIILHKISSCNLVAKNTIGYNTFNSVLYMKNNVINQLIYPNYNGYLFMLMYHTYMLQCNIFIYDDLNHNDEDDLTDIIINQIMFEQLLDYTDVWNDKQTYILFDLHEPSDDFKNYRLGKSSTNPFSGNILVKSSCTKVFQKYLGFSNATISYNTKNTTKSVRQPIDFYPPPYIYKINDLDVDNTEDNQNPENNNNTENNDNKPSKSNQHIHSKRLIIDKTTQEPLTPKKQKPNYTYIQQIFIIILLITFIYLKISF